MNDDFFRPQQQHGFIEVIVGCMFSGKTEELIKQVRRAHIAKLNVQTFKPRIDSRYHQADIASHNQNRAAAYPVNDAQELASLIAPGTQVVAIDEGQFFGEDLVEIAS